jgi:hypothetical protein
MLRKLAVTAAALTLPLTAAAQSLTYEIDPVHSYPHFMVSHLGAAFMYGRFNKTTGRLVLDKTAKTGTVEITIDAASVDTGPHELQGRPRTARRSPAHARLLQRQGVPDRDLPRHGEVDRRLAERGPGPAHAARRDPPGQP